MVNVYDNDDDDDDNDVNCRAAKVEMTIVVLLARFYSGLWGGGWCLRKQWTGQPRGLVLSHTLECRLIFPLTTKTNYVWNDLGDLDGTSKGTWYLVMTNWNVLEGLGRNAIALANGFIPG